jgi:hypothetical protein
MTMPSGRMVSPVHPSTRRSASTTRPPWSAPGRPSALRVAPGHRGHSLDMPRPPPTRAHRSRPPTRAHPGEPLLPNRHGRTVRAASRCHPPIRRPPPTRSPWLPSRLRYPGRRSRHRTLRYRLPCLPRSATRIPRRIQRAEASRPSDDDLGNRQSDRRGHEVKGASYPATSQVEAGSVVGRRPGIVDPSRFDDEPIGGLPRHAE